MGGQGFGGESLEGGGAGVLLPAAAAATGTGQAIALDDHVTHLAGHAVSAVVDLAVMDDARAHARAQGDGDEALAVAPRAHQVFGQGGAVGIVFDVKRDAEVAVEQLAERHVA